MTIRVSFALVRLFCVLPSPELLSFFTVLFPHFPSAIITICIWPAASLLIFDAAADTSRWFNACKYYVACRRGLPERTTHRRIVTMGHDCRVSAICITPGCTYSYDTSVPATEQYVVTRGGFRPGVFARLPVMWSETIGLRTRPV